MNDPKQVTITVTYSIDRDDVDVLLERLDELEAGASADMPSFSCDGYEATDEDGNAMDPESLFG